MHLSSMLRAACCIAILTAGVGIVNYSQAADSTASAQAIQFDIKAQSLASALNAFALQSHQQILFTPEIVKGKTTQGVHGFFTPEAALTELLAGTGLSSSRTAEGMLMVAAADAKGASASSGPQSAPNGAQRDQDQINPTQKTAGLEEIVVTGTHIRGAPDSSTPLQVYSATDIARSGQPTIAAFIQTLPQNFGSTSETTISGIATPGGPDNSISASSPDLHGLGSDATITLLNGHRIAPSGNDGNIVDISMIPLSAVERIEVLTDGASAIYGSDAVGGVVNIILKSSFDGAETSARYGTVSNGGSHEEQLSQTFGNTWTNGSGLVSYEFYDRTPLSAADRTNSNTAALPFTVVQEQVRQSVFATAHQSITSDLTVFADGNFAHRSTYYEDTVAGEQSEDVQSYTSVYSGTIGSRYAISQSTDAELSAGYASSESHQHYYADPSPPANTLIDETLTNTRLLTIDGVVRGALWSLPGGNILYAVGGQFRRESFDQNKPLVSEGFNANRHIGAAFAELRIPLLGPSNASANANRLELSIADRDEHYSDFGASNNPKFGLSYWAVPALKLRGTYGTSFVAPQLNDLNPIPSSVLAFNSSQFPGATPPGGDINELLVAGGNPLLTAQKAKTWTFGADFTAPEEIGLRANLTYYGTRFTNRITTITAAGINPSLVATMPALYGPSIVLLNPSASLVNSLINTPNFLNYAPDLSKGVGAIVYGNALNIAEVKTDGIDFDVAWRKSTPAVDVETGVAGTYILDYDENLRGIDPASFLNTPFNPLRFKARGRLVLTHGPFTSSAFVNYTTSYNNPNTTPSTPVASWTTVDFTTRYACKVCSGALSHLTATFAVLNVMNRNPPFLENPFGFGVNFDGNNANLLGRYYSVQLTASW